MYVLYDAPTGNSKVGIEKTEHIPFFTFLIIINFLILF